MNNSCNPDLIFHRLCKTAALPVNGRAFQLDQDNGSVNIFAVPTENGPVAFYNRCPHTGINLEWQPDRFLDSRREFIQCATHGALFRIHDGFCVYGPCIGASLQAIAVRVNDGWLEVGLPDNAAAGE